MRTVSALLTVAALLFGNEVERIERIVNDVTELRQNYETCQAELASMERRDEVDSGADDAPLQRETATRRTLCEDEIERMRAALAANEEKLLLLRSRSESKNGKGRHQEHAVAGKAEPAEAGGQKKREVQKVDEHRELQLCPTPNTFPKLLMKTEYQEMKARGSLKNGTP